MFKKENLFRVSAFIPEFIKPGDIENNLDQVSKLLEIVDTESDLVLVSYGSLSGIVDKNSTLKNFKDARLGVDRAARELQRKLDKSKLVYSIIIPEFDSFILIKPGETIWLDENYLLVKHPDEKNEVEVWLGVNVSRFSGSQFKRAIKIPGPKANLMNVSFLDNLPNDLTL